MPTLIDRYQRHRARRTRGQSLTEFALILPVLMLIIGGIIQFGIIFWGQNTLNQVVRDTGRWAATQVNCTNTASVVTTANEIAAQSALIGFTGSFPGSNVTVSWSGAGGGPVPTPCPPADNDGVAWVNVGITHQVPIFFPWIPGSGLLQSETQFRMEPQP
jgi:TadE-like protein